MTQAAQRQSLEPWIKDEINYLQHQTEGIRTMAKTRSLILGDDMGLGKTLQSLTVFGIDAKIGRGETCIVICPATVRSNWANEIEKFTRIPYVLLGETIGRNGRPKKITDNAERTAQLVDFFLMKGPRILIANYEQFTSPAYEGILSKKRFHMAIFDEAHRMKNPDSVRTQAVMAIKSTRSLLLTGTPLLNRVQELYILFHRIDPERYCNPYRFANRYCVFSSGKFRQVIGTKNEAELRTKLGEVMIRRLKKHVLGTKEPTIIPVYVGLSDEQRAIYDQVEEEFLISIPGGTEEDSLKAQGIEKFNRLDQLCVTPRNLGEEFPDSSQKLDKLIEMLDELAQNEEKVVVFTKWKPGLKRIIERSRKAMPGVPVFELSGDIPAERRQSVIDQWSAVEGPAFIVAMIKVAGVGLNMVASNTIIFVDKTVVPGLNKQAIDRCDRIGQTKPVVVYELFVHGSIEHRVDEILREKDKLNNDIVEGSVAVNNVMQMLREKMKRDL